MNAKEMKEQICTAVVNVLKTHLEKGVKIKLDRGERCPCCGHKKSQRKVSEKMVAANRENIKKAIEARRTK